MTKAGAAGAGVLAGLALAAASGPLLERLRRRAPPTFAEQEAHHRAQDAAAHASVAADPVDPTWAEPLQRELSSAFAALGPDAGAATGRLEVRGITCKSRYCGVDLGWPDYAHARADVDRLLTALALPAGCAVQLYLPQPAEAAAAYRATLILDCAQTRDAAARAPPRR